MTKFSVTRNVPFSADQVFAVAADVSRYSEFLPLVKKSLVSNVNNNADGTTTFDSELVVSYKKLGVKETLRSKVVVDPKAMTVSATANEGPVKALVTEWRIAPAGAGGSDIHFDVDYTLQSRSLQFLLSGMFDMIVRRIMNAFEERARKLYGAVTA